MATLHANPSADPSNHREGLSTATVPCVHCGSPSMPNSRGGAFCCGGCEVAYASIQSLGCPVSQNQTLPAPSLDAAACAAMDNAAFRGQHVRTDASGISRIELSIRGLHCASCVWRVEALPEQLKGVIESRVNFRRGRLQLVFDHRVIQLSEIASRLDSFGYTVGPVSDSANKQRTQADHAAMIRMAVAGACAGNAMLMAFALYAGVFDGMAGVYREAFRWGSLAVTGIALLWPGPVFFKSAWSAIRAGSVNLDAPIALALLAGGVCSTISTVTGRGEVYFDSVSVLIFALIVGRFIQQRQQRWAADSVELLFALTPHTARRITFAGGSESPQIVPTQALSVGDLVEVLAGESFPADGRIASGHTSVDVSLLTGESLPRSSGPGDSVYAGSVNVSGVVRVSITAGGIETRVAKLMSLVEECSNRRAPIVAFGDRVGSTFLAGMIILSALTFALWIGHGVHTAMENAVALLVVTCPCALGLATPLGFTLAIGRAARLGLLIKGGDAVQNLAESRGTLFLDKTGTITMGKMSVAHWYGSKHLASTVAAIEQGSTHPVGVALAAMTPVSRGSTDRISSVTHIQGRGVVANADFSEICVGSLALALSKCAHPDSRMLSMGETWAREGMTPVYVCVDGVIEGVAAVGDTIRKDSVRVISSLQRMGWDCQILSGDDPNVVEHIAKVCGITNARGGVTPEQKLAIIASSASTGKTVMVGDGVNDAAALAAAHVGISVHGGAEASLAAADIYLSRPGLSPLLTLLAGCRRTLNVIKFTLAASSIYNITAAGIAMTGHMHPIIAALIMPVSSLTAVSICVLASTFKEEQV